MAEDWLSQCYYSNRQKLAATKELQIKNDTSYGAFENLVIYDALVRSGCTQSPLINSSDSNLQHEWLFDIYSQKCDKLANSNEWQVFVADTTFEEFGDLLVYDFLHKSGCVYTPLVGNSRVTVARCLKDEQINIVAMTEGISSGGKRFHQTIICKDPLKYPIGQLYIFVPKITIKSDFQRSIAGLNFQKSLNDSYGEELQEFSNTYVAQAVKDYSLYDRDDPERSLYYLETLCKNLFPLWEPRWGPQQHMLEHGSSIIVFRVYKTTGDMQKYIRSSRRRVPTVNGGSAQVTIQQPVVSEQEFRRQQVMLRKILLH